MTHPVWPLFDLRITTPTVELRYIDDQLACELAVLAAKGVHDPSFMPFTLPWTDVAPPEQERRTMQWFWRCRAETEPGRFHLGLAVLVDGEAVGTTSIGVADFDVLGEFETGSWLGVAHQGRGLGTALRLATLHLGFAGMGARTARTAAFADNAPSLGVTRRLGYTQVGTEQMVRRGETATQLRFHMSRAHWETNLRTDDIVIEGLDPCRELLGLG
ncbi:MAG: GNAT family protein [Ilumatobacteraceae bacterium]